MQIDEARKLILEGVDENGLIGRSVTGDFVRLKDLDNFDPMLIQAIKEMLVSGELEQLPSAGQSRSTLSFRKGAGTK